MQQLSEELRILDALNANKLLSIRFPSTLEKQYRQFYIAQIISQRKVISLISLFIFTGFIFLDYIVWPEFADRLMAIRFIGIAPLCTLCLGLCFLTSFKQNSHLVMAVAITVAGMTIALMATQIPSPINELYYLGFIPLCAYSVGVARLPFKYTAAVIWGLFLIYISLDGLYPFEKIEVNNYYYNDTFKVFFIVLWMSINSIVMFSSYLTEVNFRRNFIQQRILANEKKELSYLSEKLHQLSITDPLTGLYNRRFFNDQFALFWDAGVQARYGISLLIIDIDQFKKYNDEYGHIKGDQCLVQIANAIAQCQLPRQHVVARFGGEEFVVLFRADKIVDGYAEQIAKAVADLHIPHASDAYAEFVTISIGAISFIPTLAMSATDMLEQADKQLYRAKNAGRGCYKVA
jgi:diguanylate cyclase (GGDEF)-like protein